MTPQYNFVDDLWDSGADVIAVTTNGQMGKTGLLMGGGSALQAKERYPGLPRLAQTRITNGYVDGAVAKLNEGPHFLYGWLPINIYIPSQVRLTIGLFQTKGLIRENSLPALIGHSALMLRAWLLNHPKVTVALAFPGIGHGKLLPEQVYPLLAELPERVTIYGNKLP